MSEQEMQFADPDWKPTAARRTQQDNTAAYAPQPLHNHAFDTSQSADAASYTQGYRGSLPQDQQQMSYAPPYVQQMPPRPAGRTRGRSRWWMWVIILIIVISFIGNMSHSFNAPRSDQGPFTSRPGPSQQVYNFDLGNASQIAINDSSGSIQLQYGNANSGQIEVQTDAADGNVPQEEFNGGTLTITQNSGDIVVTLPSQIAVSLEATNGNIEVDGYNGQVSAQTDSGSIVLNGDALSGSSVISSNSGNIYLAQGSVSGTTNLSTSNGSITLDQEDLSGQFTANVGVSGAIQFNGTLDAKGSYNFTSDQGNIDLTLPADTSMHVQKSIGAGGSFTSDFPASTGNAPQATLEVKTSSGVVSIHER